jgi:hypothetical protein
VRVLRPVIEIPMLAMCHAWEELALGGSRALEFVGHDYARCIGQPFKELTKELRCSFLVPPALHQDIEDIPVLIDGTPQIVTFSLDRENSSSICHVSPGRGRWRWS